MANWNKNEVATKTGQDSSANEKAMVNQEMSKEVEVKGSIFDLLNKNVPLSCNFEYVGEDNQTRGVTYVDGNKIRGDFFTTTTEGMMENHMISDGEYVYTWSSAMPQGIKMKIDEFEKDMDLKPNENMKQEDQSELLKGDYDYKCLPWNTDSSVFELPSDIEFTDLSEMMNSLQQTIPNALNLCASCDKAGDAASVAACKKALNCN